MNCSVVVSIHEPTFVPTYSNVLSGQLESCTCFLFFNSHDHISVLYTASCSNATLATLSHRLVFILARLYHQPLSGILAVLYDFFHLLITFMLTTRHTVCDSWFNLKFTYSNYFQSKLPE